MPFNIILMSKDNNNLLSRVLNFFAIINWICIIDGYNGYVRVKDWIWK
jgi:hypothetical protein